MTIFNLRESKLGMTLVEMVISLVILSILMSATMGMIISSNNLFISTTQSALDKQVGNHVFDFVESVLKYTTHMSIYDASEASKGTSIQSLSINVTDDDTNSGTIQYKRANEDDPFALYEQSFYGNRTVSYSVHKVGNQSKHVKLVVTVYRNGKAVYSRQAIIKCLNLNLVAIGDGANPITDKSSADAVNQFITFSVDEQLLNGGNNAFSLEYKISEYMAKYNKIQNDYVAQLSKAYGKLNGRYNATEDPGVKGTSDTDRGRIQRDLYATRISAVTKIIFGDGVTATKFDSNNIDSCVNLRDHFQNEIKDLLKFTPTAAGFSNGRFSSATIGAAGSGGDISYTTHTGDPYYGVVATKEELYAGFMLTYYDKDNNGTVSKKEYPQFEGDSFFAGTSLQAYVDNTNSNQMVIMSYFKDNVSNDNYKGLIQTATENVYSYDGAEALAYDANLAKHYVSNDPDAFGGENKNMYGYSSAVTDKTGGSNISFRYNAGGMSAVYVYTYGNDGDTNTIGTYTDTTSYLAYRANWDDVFDALRSRMGTIEITNLKSKSNQRVNNTNVTELSTTAPNDLYEGWYYIREDNARYVFYLEAASNAPTESSGKRIAVKAGNELKFYSYNYKLLYYYYDQAQFSMAASGEKYTIPTTYTNPVAHQFTDYVLYGVDWNSWFNSSPQGLLNRLLTTVSSFVTSLFGREVNKTVTGISGANAVQSLGNHGQYTINNMSSTVASYNLAWTVYSPKRGTWYYIPAKSTRLSGAVSSISWASDKDQPVPLDCDLDAGTWSSSSGLIQDIETRKMSGSGFFGLVDTTSDVLWVALPTGNTVDVSSLTD